MDDLDTYLGAENGRVRAQCGRCDRIRLAPLDDFAGRRPGVWMKMKVAGADLEKWVCPACREKLQKKR